jgi:hypothetical protein
MGRPLCCCSPLTLRARISVPTAWNFSGPQSFPEGQSRPGEFGPREVHMNGVIYLVGLVVIVLAILSLFGLR